MQEIKNGIDRTHERLSLIQYRVWILGRHCRKRIATPKGRISSGNTFTAYSQESVEERDVGMYSHERKIIGDKMATAILLIRLWRKLVSGHFLRAFR